MLPPTDLLKLLFDSKVINKTCFLCLRESEDITNIQETIEIHDECGSINIPLCHLFKSILPSIDFIFQMVCKSCTDLVIKLFVVVKNNIIKTTNLCKIVDDLQKEIDINISTGFTTDKCKLKINFPINTDSEAVENITVDTKDKFECGKCAMEFSSKEVLKEHNKITHRNTNEAVICHICGKKCKTPNTLKAHLNCHNEKQCPYCSKVLKTHSHYKIHIRNHSAKIVRRCNRTYYNCNDCNYISLNKKSLEAHINKMHLHIRPFQCEICHKGFYKNSNLVEHKVTHENVKNATCETCGDNYSSVRTLREHIKRKHMEKTEVCLLCGKKYSIKKELTQHMKRGNCQSIATEGVNTLVTLKCGEDSGTYDLIE